MDISGKITGITYAAHLADGLQEVPLAGFDINSAPGKCVVADGLARFAVSKWISPKRTRSYPYQRVYDTLGVSKKITVIPIVKDEGAAGDRDFLQWDTVSLMSLLDVFVVFAYYNDAQRRGNKITAQKFDNQYVVEKIKEIENYHGSALHWNIKELREGLTDKLSRMKESYAAISVKCGVKMHSEQGIETFAQAIGSTLEQFMTFSREKAKDAQSREIVTKQPKERLLSSSKSRITITDYHGGEYYFTVDEAIVDGDTLLLIEDKHTRRGKLPSLNDIKDGLLKMILYSNMQDVECDGEIMRQLPILVLTSENIDGSISSTSNSDSIEQFCQRNSMSARDRVIVNTLFTEAQQNGFVVQISSAQ